MAKDERPITAMDAMVHADYACASLDAWSRHFYEQFFRQQESIAELRERVMELEEKLEKEKK